MRINNINMNTTKKIAFALLIPAILSSCSAQNPAAVRHKGNYYYGKDGVSKYAIVYPGQTLLQIAVENNISLKDLAKINKISPPYRIYAGQHIRLPNELYHIVQPGESLMGISLRYKVSFADMVKINDIHPPYHVKIGEKLRIPLTSKDNTIHAEELDPYKGVAQEKAAPIIPLDDGGSNISNSKSEASKDAYEEEEFQSLEKQLGDEEGRNKSKSLLKENGNSPATDLSYSLPTPLNSDKFVWPIGDNAKVISHYGQSPGKFSEGMSIAAPLNSPVAAVSRGEVIYVGNDVEGYGKMVIIRHENDILSAYAHNSSVLVKKGDKVSRGQTIAKVGKTGDVDKAQLYFSLRKGKSTINPEKLLK
ncbi:hypothetical protein NF27_HS00400 [Candidatus Jidaibacter acanthamoeba]|uniref:LysM domain-containing protein n=2 Tax=Candidatus Jidaibacter acanthamoebae TaxID=86105 RepID=A0A0C1QJW9_9RICK|nr:hypothetical protein NF27_HS00400 [Candidatus Jidaibacter acanthamoeba]